MGVGPHLVGGERGEGARAQESGVKGLAVGAVGARYFPILHVRPLQKKTAKGPRTALTKPDIGFDLDATSFPHATEATHAAPQQQLASPVTDGGRPPSAEAVGASETNVKPRWACTRAALAVGSSLLPHSQHVLA